MAAEPEKKQIISEKHSRANEIVALVLLTLTVLLFLCLVTYSPTDWSLNTSSAQKTQNWIGVIGSVTADLLFQLIGLTAYFLPLLLGLIAWRVFRSDGLYASFGRIAGYVLFLVSAAAQLALFDFRGGIIGVFFAQFFSYLIGRIGAGILLTAFFLTAVLLITNLSYFSFFDNFKPAFDKFKSMFDNLKNYLKQWFAGFREWREKQKKTAAERAQKQAEEFKTDQQQQPALDKNGTKTTISPGERTSISLASFAESLYPSNKNLVLKS